MSYSILDTVVQFLKEDNWHFQEDEEKSIISMKFSGEHGTWTCVAQALEKHQELLFYSILDTKVPPDKRQAVSEYLTRANYGLRLGNFEMDFSDGEVRYKTSIDVEGGQLTPSMSKVMAYANLQTMDKYFPGIMEVIYTKHPPEEVIHAVEG